MFERKRETSATRKGALAIQGDSEVYRTLVEGSLDISYVADPSGNLTYVSPQVANYGLDPASLVGTSLFSLVSSQDRKHISADYSKTLSTGDSFRAVFRIVDAKGAEHWVEERGTPLKDDRGAITGFAGILRDITERRDAEKALADEHSLVRTLLGTSPDHIYVKDRESRFIIANQTLAEIMGARSPSSLIGKTDSDFFPQKLAAKFLADEQEVMSTGQPLIDCEEQSLNITAGRSTWISTTKVALRDSTGMIVGIVGIGRDITQKKRAAEALRQSEEEYRSLVENLKVGVFRLHLAPDGHRIVKANRAMADILGYSSTADLLASPPASLCSASMETVIATLRSRGFIRNHEMRCRRLDGTEIWIMLTASAHAENDGNLRMMDGIVEDFTDRKKTQEDLLRANMRLSGALSRLRETEQKIIQHERLSALGQMASGIAHSFNNALMPILGFSELLLKHPDLLTNREGTLDMMKDIFNAAQTAAAAVKSLRSFYRPMEETDFRVIDPKALVESAIAITQPRWKEEMAAQGISIDIVKQFEEVYPIHGLEARLRESLVSMILNSIDAMPNGGTLTLRLRNDDKWVVMEIQDSGTGMDAETKRHCFEPFFTTKGPQGTGMGLAVTYGVVRHHGGTIDVESESGFGTLMAIRLPAFASRTNAVPVEQPTKSPPPLRVLAIDDEIWSRDTIKRLLSLKDHTVVTAETGREGIERFKEGAFDLVLTDRALPDMSGDDVAAAIRKLSKTVPIVMLTGFGELMQYTGDVPDSIDALLPKPVTREELYSGVAKAYSKHAK